MATTASEEPNNEEVDDYMSMVIPDPSAKKPESAIQRRARKQRENEDRSRHKSKAEREAEKAATRDAVLGTAIDSSNKGFKMLAKLGFKPGETLGRSDTARTEPVQVSVKGDRGGIGMDSEKKRKIREAAESEAKKIKVDQEDYRTRVRREREEKRLAGLLAAAQKVAEKLDAEKEDSGIESERPMQKRPLTSINVLYRSLEENRREAERAQNLKAELHNSLAQLQDNDDDEEDDDDRIAMGKPSKINAFEEDSDEEDKELQEFNALDLDERVQKVVDYLRDEHQYCFWCKYQYPDKAMDGCPGTTEDEHG